MYFQNYIETGGLLDETEKVVSRWPELSTGVILERTDDRKQQFNSFRPAPSK